MSIDNKVLTDRTNYLLGLCERTLATRETDPGTIPRARVSAELFAELRAAGLSLMLKVAGTAHPFFQEFDRLVLRAAPADVERARGILKSVKAELDAGLVG